MPNFFRRVRNIVKNEDWLRYVLSVSARMEQRGSHSTDFHEILFEYFCKIFEKIQICLKF